MPNLRLTVLVLAAATALAPPAYAKTTEPAAESALRGYVLGRYAYADDALERSARYFDQARQLDPAAPVLTRRAFDLAVAAGDFARAAVLAPTMAAAEQSDPDVVMVRLADAIARRDWKAAEVLRPGLSTAGYSAVVGPIVDAWLQFGRGRTDAALAALEPANFNGFARSYVQEQRAHMLAAAGRWQDASDAYANLLTATSSGGAFLRAAEADARAMAGDKVGAAKLLVGEEPPIAAARTRLTENKRIGGLAPDPRRGIAWLSVRLAADLSRDKPVALSVLFARMASFLAPDVSATWLVSGDVLARSDQRDAALEAYSHIPDGDALAATARVRRAEVLEALDRGAEAGVLLTARTAAADADADDWTRLGDWHRRAERFPQAIAAYSRAIALSSGGDTANWGLWFLRGSMEERANQWPAAEVDLREALRRSPDEPIVLNYLGYSLLDRATATAEAATLIERAAKLRPGDGGIIDSLGWSQFRQGRYADAVTTLERAATLEPTDPTVTEHLGDAYWRTGRRIEARFKWRAASDLDPSAAQKTALRAKLDYGLDAALAMAVPK